MTSKQTNQAESLMMAISTLSCRIKIQAKKNKNINIIHTAELRPSKVFRVMPYLKKS
jgi:hypothetical protein